MNRNPLLNLCGLVAAAAILATTSCTSPNAGQVGAIGGIEGTISWDKGGERPDPSVIDQAISITAVTVKLTPGGSGTLGSTTATPIPGANVAFGVPLDSKSRVTVTYTVTKLPLDTAIQLEVKPKRVQGLFLRDGNPQDAICTFAQPLVSRFDFKFVPAP